MKLSKGLVVCTVLLCCLKYTSSTAWVRKAARLNVPLLGLGYSCGDCPSHFCDDDESVIYGYCCGCSKFYDDLPIKCSSRIECPPNGYDLCDDYEYMLHCCC